MTDQANVDWVKHVTGTIAIATAACGGGTEPPSALLLMLAGISASSGDELLPLRMQRFFVLLHAHLLPSAPWGRDGARTCLPWAQLLRPCPDKRPGPLLSGMGSRFLKC